MGEIDYTGIGVRFTNNGSGETLYQKAQGQADIENAANPGHVNLTQLDITVPGYTFGDFIMNPLNGDGNAHITVIDNFAHTFDYDLGNGQNYLTITTANGESISEITISVSCLTDDTACITSGPGFLQFKQPRISDPAPVVTPTPEPASLALLRHSSRRAQLLLAASSSTRLNLSSVPSWAVLPSAAFFFDQAVRLASMTSEESLS